MSKIIKLSKSLVSDVDLSPLCKYLEWNEQHKKYIMCPCGQEAYQLYGYLTQFIDGDIADVGTYYGTSALALSLNENNNVSTVDIVKCIPDNVNVLTPLDRPNIKMHVVHGQAIISKIAQCQLVLLDIDPHDGDAEINFFDLLIQHGFKGILVADDINLNNGMKKFWNYIPSNYKKYDLTSIGHWSGTGLVVFDPSYIDVVYES
jgi:hypothetical protein